MLSSPGTQGSTTVISHSKGKWHSDILLIKATFPLFRGGKENIQQESHLECSPVLYIFY